MSESVPESNPASVLEPAKDPWRVAFIEFEKRDVKMVKDFQEEIDTLLVVVSRPHRIFIRRLITLASQAGLFSAVLTAFVVESYQSLQEDLAQTSVDLLRHISHQLANSSYPSAPNSSHFQAQRSDVRVNVCWFVSLLLSLVVALFGIFLKQWMRTYMKWTDVTPDRAAVAIRQVRYRGLETWRLGAILTLLPTLLQLSVILFLTGLLVFLWNLDHMVAIVMAVLLGITFFIVAAVTVLPAVSQSCPFRSPLSEILATSFPYAQFICNAFCLFIISGFISGCTYFPDYGTGDCLAKWLCTRYSMGCWDWDILVSWLRARSKITSWVKADEDVIDQYNRNSHRVGMHVGAMLHLCCTTQSQPLWSAAIATIVAELTPDHPLRSMPDMVYWNEVWWPVLGHIILFTEKELETPTYSVFRALSMFSRLSSPTKDSWLSFLMHSKTRVSKSDSSPVVKSYLLCCLASIESTTGSQCMRAFMEVLEAQYAKLTDAQLGNIAYCLDAVFDIDYSSHVLLASLSGLSFPVQIALGLNTRYRHRVR
jgi:hypothetical protein